MLDKDLPFWNAILEGSISLFHPPMTSSDLGVAPWAAPRHHSNKFFRSKAVVNVQLGAWYQVCF